MFHNSALSVETYFTNLSCLVHKEEREGLIPSNEIIPQSNLARINLVIPEHWITSSCTGGEDNLGSFQQAGQVGLFWDAATSPWICEPHFSALLLSLSLELAFKSVLHHIAINLFHSAESQDGNSDPCQATSDVVHGNVGLSYCKHLHPEVHCTSNNTHCNLQSL